MTRITATIWSLVGVMDCVFGGLGVLMVLERLVMVWFCGCTG